MNDTGTVIKKAGNLSATNFVSTVLYEKFIIGTISMNEYYLCVAFNNFTFKK